MGRVTRQLRNNYLLFFFIRKMQVLEARLSYYRKKILSNFQIERIYCENAQNKIKKIILWKAEFINCTNFGQ